MPLSPRRLLLTALASLLCLLGGVGAATASASTMPAEGIFESCTLDTQMQTCLNRLQVMHQGGIKVVVMPASWTSLNALATYAGAAHSLGMSVMWALGDQGWWQSPATSTNMAGYYGGFTSACGCNQNGPLISYIAHWLGALPGTYGYYAADDSMLSAGDRAGVAAYVARIKQQDPSHTLMISAANGGQATTYQGVADTVGQEIYPKTTTSLLPVNANQDIWGGVAQEVKDTQRAANNAGKQSTFILQAFSWGDNLDDGTAIGECSPSESKLACYQHLPYPSGGEQLALRNTVLKNAHPKLILWWSFQGTYGQAGNDTYSIYPTGSGAAAHWAGLAAAILAPAPVTAVKAKVASKRKPAHTARTHKRHKRTHARRHVHHAKRHAKRHTKRHATLQARV
ncbi:MAG: hypothetical protein QOD66_1584 [Solirubrobacteraceae bacterium]|nr:hypothetical protein [Solirubrobacteraceae bacterium]